MTHETENDDLSEPRHEKPAQETDERERQHLENEKKALRYNATINRLTAGLLFVGVATLIVLGAHGYLFWRTDETARSAQRAFVAVRDVRADALGPIGSADIAYAISLIWENSGSTEPRDLRIGSLLTVDKSPPSRWPIKENNGFGRVLLPKADTVVGSMTTTGALLNDTRDNADFVSVFSYARYRDAYGAKHLTLFCRGLDAADIDYSKNRVTGTIPSSECNDYNCVDHDCDQYASTPELRWLLAYIE